MTPAEFKNLMKLGRLAKHFMDVAMAGVLKNPGTIEFKTKSELQIARSWTNEYEDAIAMNDVYSALSNRQLPAGNWALIVAAIDLSRITIRAGEACALLVTQLAGDEKLSKLLDEEDHDQAISDAFLVHGDPFLAKAFAPPAPGGP